MDILDITGHKLLRDDDGNVVDTAIGIGRVPKGAHGVMPSPASITSSVGDLRLRRVMLKLMEMVGGDRRIGVSEFREFTTWIEIIFLLVDAEIDGSANRGVVEFNNFAGVHNFFENHKCSSLNSIGLKIFGMPCREGENRFNQLNSSGTGSKLRLNRLGC